MICEEIIVQSKKPTPNIVIYIVNVIFYYMLCMYVCVCVYVCICVCICVFVCVCAHACVHVVGVLITLNYTHYQPFTEELTLCINRPRLLCTCNEAWNAFEMSFTSTDSTCT